jgi:hypothetical protein
LRSRAIASLAAARADVDGVRQAEVAGRDLDDGGTEVGEDLRAVRPGDGEAEVEHDDPGQWRGGDVGGALARSSSRRPRVDEARRRLGHDGPWPDRWTWCALEDVRVPRLSDRAVDGIVDLDDHAFALERHVHQAVLGRQDRLRRSAGLGEPPDPLVAGECGDSRRRLDVLVRLVLDLRLVVVSRIDDRAPGHGRDFVRSCGGARDRLADEVVLERRPLVQPRAVARLEQPLGRPPVEVPEPVARMHRRNSLPAHGVLHQNRLEQRRLDELSYPLSARGRRAPR